MVTPYLLVTGDFKKTGGMDRANYALAHYLAHQGYPVHLVAHTAASELLTYDNVAFYPVPKPLNSYLLGSFGLNRTGQAIARSVSAQGGRVIVNGGNCNWHDINWVLHVHAADGLYPPSGVLQRWKRYIDYQLALRDERRIVPQATLVLTECDRNRVDIIERLKVPEANVKRVYLGIDAERFKPLPAHERQRVRQSLSLPGDRPLILFVGALGNRRKGFDVLFQAWQRLNPMPTWDAMLVVVGRGGEAMTWQQRAIATGMETTMTFLGFVPQLAELMAACDLLVLPSRYEGYALVAQEALCCGIPALVSLASGIAERYPATLSHLLLPDPENVTDLVERLLHWRGAIATIQAHIQPFATELRQFTWNHMAQHIIQHIEASSVH